MTDGPSLLHDEVRPGDVLAGKYRVERILGAGGMGVVVAAHHLQLDEKVALKFLLPEAVDNKEAIARFAREARAAAKIKSEHVARVTDVGQLDNGAPYMVMEYLEGSDLSQLLRERGPLPVDQAVDFVLQACEAIADAHALGIIHRDLKPANLFCIRRSDGQLSIKVLDFGISKLTGAGAPGLDMTRTSTLMGSPLYMSPEQMRSSREVDVRADIWSLGIILFELVAGCLPFQAESVTELAIRVATEPPPPLRSFCASAPAGLEQVIFRCLERERDRRYRDVGELALALKDFGSRRARLSVERVLSISGHDLPASGLFPSGAPPAPAPPPASGSIPASSSPGTNPPWGHATSSTKGPPRAALIVAAVGVVGLLATGGAILARGPSASVPTAGTSPVVVSVPAIRVEPSAARAPPEPSSSPAASPPASAAVPPAVAAAVPPAPTVTAPARASTPRAVSAPSAAASAPPPAAAARCDPPYYFDAKGNRVFKKECL